MANCGRCGEALRGKFCTACGAPAPQVADPPVVIPEGDWVVAIVRGPIAAGRAVVVPSGFRFHAFVGAQAWAASPEGYKIPDRMTFTLEAGQHASPETCDLGAYVRLAGVPVTYDWPLAKVTTPTGAFKAIVSLQALFRLEDVFATVKMLGLSTGLSPEDGGGDLVQQPISYVVDALLTERLGAAWSIQGLESGAQMPDFCRAVETMYNTPNKKIEKYYAGTGVQITAAHLSFTALAAPAAIGAGAKVIVVGPDGNQYPGVVQQLAPGQALVTFPGGTQQWVPTQYLTAV